MQPALACAFFAFFGTPLPLLKENILDLVPKRVLTNDGFDNLKLSLRSIVFVSGYSLYQVKDLNALNNFPKDRVLAIEMRTWTESNEELRAIRAWPTIRHR